MKTEYTNEDIIDITDNFVDYCISVQNEVDELRALVQSILGCDNDAIEEFRNYVLIEFNN